MFVVNCYRLTCLLYFVLNYILMSFCIELLSSFSKFVSILTRVYSKQNKDYVDFPT